MPVQNDRSGGSSRSADNAAEPNCADNSPTTGSEMPTRRDVLRQGRKLAYVVPVVMTLSAQEALAAPSNPSATPSSCVDSGEACFSDSDCCSGECNVGFCS